MADIEIEQQYKDLVQQAIDGNAAAKARLRSIMLGNNPNAREQCCLHLSAIDDSKPCTSEVAHYFKLAADRKSSFARTEYIKYLHKLSIDNYNMAMRYDVGMPPDLDPITDQADLSERVKRAGELRSQAEQYRALANGYDAEAVRYLKSAADCGVSAMQLEYSRYSCEQAKQHRGLANNYTLEASGYRIDMDQEDSAAQIGHVKHLQDLAAQSNTIADNYDTEAARYFWLVAGSGSPIGQYEYAHCLLEGKGVEQNVPMALYYYKLAADQKYFLAQFDYATLLERGCGVRTNIKTAMKYFKKAADGGYLQAQLKYAQLLRDGETPDLGEAVHYLKLAADQGSLSAQLECAKFFNDGTGVPIDLELAAYYYKLAADQGSAHAQYKYAMCCATGNGVPMDKEEAMHYYKSAASQDYPPGEYGYAEYLMVEDLELGLFWLQHAANDGNADAQYDLACRLRDGTDVPKDLPSAIYYFTRAVEGGHHDGLRALEECCKSVGNEAMIHYNKVCADQGNPDSALDYAQYLEYEGDDIITLGYYKFALDLKCAKIRESSKDFKDNPPHATQDLKWVMARQSFDNLLARLKIKGLVGIKDGKIVAAGNRTIIEVAQKKAKEYDPFEPQQEDSKSDTSEEEENERGC